MAAEHGRIAIEIKNSKLRYLIGTDELASFDLDTLALVAEHTNDRGPMEDDWFIVFVGGRPTISVEVPVRLGLRPLHLLSQHFGISLQPGLSGSTDFASRIIWPPELADRPFYDYTPARRSGLLGRLIDRVLPRISWQMTAEVIARIQAVDGTHGSEHSACAQPDEG